MLWRKNPSASRHMSYLWRDYLEVDNGGIFKHIYSYFRLVPHDCVNAKINHIQFHGDCLFFEFSKSKGHQKREKYLCRSIKKCGCVQCSHYRGICFAILMYWRVMQLFEGKSQYTQYATRLTKLSKQDI